MEKTKGATDGRIKAIYYSASDPFTPVSVVLNSHDQENAEDGDVFTINGSELQYLFSVYGDYGVGDDVAIVWENERHRRKPPTYTVVDVVGDE